MRQRETNVRFSPGDLGWTIGDTVTKRLCIIVRPREQSCRHLPYSMRAWSGNRSSLAFLPRVCVGTDRKRERGSFVEGRYDGKARCTIKEKAKQVKKKKAKNLEPKRGEETSRVSGGGEKAWTVGFDRVSMFGSAEEEEEEEQPYPRVSSHKEVAPVSSVGNDDSQVVRFFLRTSTLDEHS